MVYIFTDMESMDYKCFQQIFKYLPSQRKEKAEGYRFFKDQRLSALAFMLLKYGVLMEFGIELTEDTELGIGENGKPYLNGCEHMHFNLSHCISGVACVISKKSVGIDIQNPEAFDYKVAEHVCSKQELERLRLTCKQQALFNRYWTLKESYVKASGKGISDDIKKLDFSKTMEAESFSVYGMNFNILQNELYTVSVCATEIFESNKWVYPSLMELEEVIQARRKNDVQPKK